MRRFFAFSLIFLAASVATAESARVADLPDVPMFTQDKGGKPDLRFIERHEGFVTEARQTTVHPLLAAIADAVVAPLGELLGGPVSAAVPATAPASISTPATAPAVRIVDYGTILSVDAGVIRWVPWGEKADAVKLVPTSADVSVVINLETGKVADLKEAMWLKVLERDADGKAKRIIAGQFLQEDGNKVVVFKGLPEEFLVYRSEGWYTNTAGGVQFKVQPMGAGKSPSNPGTNLRAAKYQEPAGGFVVYFPKTLDGAVLGWGGFKPGANVADADGKVLVNKETCTDYYWKHLKNPARPEAGYVSGMTEFTIRKMPPRP